MRTLELAFPRCESYARVVLGKRGHRTRGRDCEPIAEFRQALASELLVGREPIAEFDARFGRREPNTRPIVDRAVNQTDRALRSRGQADPRAIDAWVAERWRAPREAAGLEVSACELVARIEALPARLRLLLKLKEAWYYWPGYPRLDEPLPMDAAEGREVSQRHDGRPACEVERALRRSLAGPDSVPGRAAGHRDCVPARAIAWFLGYGDEHTVNARYYQLKRQISRELQAV